MYLLFGANLLLICSSVNLVAAIVRIEERGGEPVARKYHVQVKRVDPSGEQHEIGLRFRV